MRFVELKNSLKNGYKPFYVLSGDDAYVLSLAEKTLLSLSSLPDMNSVFLDAPQCEEIVVAANTLPLGDDTRVVIERNFLSDASVLKTYLESPSHTTVLVIESPLLSQNLSQISQYAELIDCSRLDKDTLTRFIANECAKKGAAVTGEAARLLIEKCNRYLARIVAETDKLCAYAYGGTIKSDVVVSMVNSDLEYKPYELADSILNGNGEKAVRLANDMIADGAAGVFGLIYSHFRQLLYVAISGEEAKTAFKLTDYKYKLLKSQAAALKPVALKRICDKLHKIDEDYKKGAIGDKLAIIEFVTSVVGERK